MPLPAATRGTNMIRGTMPDPPNPFYAPELAKPMADLKRSFRAVLEPIVLPMLLWLERRLARHK